jgi:WD40 domain-containing protein
MDSTGSAKKRTSDVMKRITSFVGLLATLTTGSAVAQEQAKPAPRPAGVYREMGSSRFLNFGRVFAVSFSRDGKTLAASCWDGTVWVGDIASGKIIHQWEAHRGQSHVHAFSPDGKTLAAVSGDGIVRLWDVATGKPLRELKGHSGRLQWVGFSGDGRLLGSQCSKALRLWKVPSYEEIREIPGVDKFFSAFTPALGFSGSLLAYAPNRESLLLVDPASGQEIRRIDTPVPYGGSLSLSADGKYLILQPNYGPARLWLVSSGRELPSPGAQRYGRANVALAPDSRIMALGLSDSTIELVEFASRRVRARVANLEIPEGCLAFSPDGRTLAIGSADRSVLLWDVTGRREGDALAPLALSADELQSLWKDLHGDDGARVHRAIWKLVAGGRETVPFLAKQLAPVQSAEPESTARLVRDLEAPQFIVRNKAFEALVKLGEAAEEFVQARLKEPLPVETRRRLEQLSQRNEVAWSTQWQTLRAFEVLEQIGTPAAKDLLSRLAAGAPGARLTLQAQASLERLKSLKRTP